MSKHVVVIAGIETVRDPDGHVKELSVTFVNNAKTIEYDELKKGSAVTIIDARDHLKADNPIASLWAAIAALPSVDTIYYSGHSGPTEMYVFSHVRKELSDEKRYFTEGDPYWRANYNKGAEIFLFGCQTSGTCGQRCDGTIAQDIANRSGCVVYGYASRTSQQKREDGRFYQRPDYPTLYKFTPKKIDK